MKGSRVLLDSDFCNMLTEINSEKIDSRRLIANLIVTLEITPYIHEFLVKHELFHNEIIQEFISNGKIKTLTFTEITSNDLYKSLYETTFEEYFYTMNDEDFLTVSPSCDCFNYRKSGYNLGEIHSLIAARFLNIPLFYSNDSGAKMLAQKYNSQSSKVELISGLDLIIKYKETNLFDRNIRRAIFNKYEKAHWKERFNVATLQK